MFLTFGAVAPDSGARATALESGSEKIAWISLHLGYYMEEKEKRKDCMDQPSTGDNFKESDRELGFPGPP